MKRRDFQALFVILSVFLFAPPEAVGFVKTALAKVVISEIGAYESSGHEWIEIYNTASTSIDIFGWKFWEAGANHGLKEVQGDFIIEPNEYAVITQNNDNFLLDYPGVATTIFDSSWSSLKETGEEIGLKNAEGEFVEQFTYVPAKDFSLQKINLNIDDYTALNWTEHASDNTVGRENMFVESVLVVEEVSSTEVLVEEVVIENFSVGSGEEVLPEGYSARSVVINEFVSDPADGQVEFVELFNNFSDPIDLEGWTLEDGSEAVTKLEGVIEVAGFFVIEKPKGNLNNSGDEIVLYDARGGEIDKVVYGNWDDGNLADNAERPDDPYSSARHTDGADTNNDFFDFILTQMVTKGKPNIILTKQTEVKKTEEPVVENFIFINEVFPNPTGSDSEAEFIELKNLGSEAVDISGWILGDNSRKRFIIGEQKIFPGEIIVFFRAKTGIALNNSGEEEVFLYRSPDVLVDSVKYSGPVLEDFSYAKRDGEWQWTSQFTPGVENIIVTPNLPPEILVEAPDEAVVGEVVVFDASDTIDPEGGELKFFWQSGTSISSTEQIFNYAFDRAGNRNINLSVVDDHGHEVKKTIKISIFRPELEVEVKLENSESDLVGLEIVSPTIDGYLDVRLHEIRDLPLGTKVRVNGVVAVLPGVFGLQYIYIVDDGGVQVYMFKKDFPELKVGDRVEVVGELSLAYGETRLKIKDKKDIKKLEYFGSPVAIKFDISEIGESYEGWLLRVEGEITEIKSSYIYVDDGTAELKVYFKKGAGIKKDWKVGDGVRVVGLLSERSGEFQLLPRGQGDIEKISSLVEPDLVVLENIVAPKDKDVAEKYLTATAGGLTSILIGLFARARGVAVAGGLKKFGRLAVATVIKKKL